jgi:hypothetical protein
MKLFDIIWLAPKEHLHDLLTEKEMEPIQVFVKETAQGWCGWPASWSPQARKESIEVEYPSGVWGKVSI